jgi:hypothetical protein
MEQKEINEIKQTEEFRNLKADIFLHNKIRECSLIFGLIIFLVLIPPLFTGMGFGTHMCVNEQQDTSLTDAQRIFKGTDCNGYAAMWMDGALPAIGVGFVIFLIYIFIACNLEEAEKKALMIIERRRDTQLRLRNQKV